MKKRMFFVVLILVVLCTGSLFAQEKRGFIKPTFGFGLTREMAKGGGGQNFLNFFVDVDFVNSFGLTFGLQGNFLSSMGGMGGDGFPPTSFPSLGAGYTYDGGNFNVGAKVVIFGIGDFGGLGPDISATWFFHKAAGLTLDVAWIINFGDGGGSILFAKAGVSIRI